MADSAAAFIAQSAIDSLATDSAAIGAERGDSSARGGRYADFIASEADSVVRLLVVLNALRGDDAIRTVPAIGLLMTNMADNFAARTPPEDLQAVHSQLTTSLQGMASDIVRVANLLNINCDQERSKGLACDEPRLKMAGVQRALDAISSADNQVIQYRLARARAARMLAERGVTLPEAPY